MSSAYENEAFSHFYDRLVAEHLPHDDLWIDSVDEIYLEIIRRSFSSTEKEKLVVELGCGTGDNLLNFAKLYTGQHEQVRFVGIDLSEAMLNRAKEKLAINPSIDTIEFHQGNMIKLDGLVESESADCILIPAGTFHHLTNDEERQQLIEQIRRALRSETGLCGIYLLPEAMIHVETSGDDDAGDEEVGEHAERFRMISSKNQQTDDGDWICDQTFTFDGPPKVELNWQLRTCSAKKLIKLFQENDLQVTHCCVNGKDLISYDEYCSLSSLDASKPVIIVFRTRKSTN